MTHSKPRRWTIIALLAVALVSQGGMCDPGICPEVTIADSPSDAFEV